jgi:TatD DNase family protein
MIDTHAHIDSDEFDNDFSEMLERSKIAGVNEIIIPAIKNCRFDKVFELTQKYDNIFAGFGVHPHHAHELNEEILGRIEKFSSNGKVIAIGEIGLDYYYDFCPVDVQKEAFRKQIKLAKESKLPLIIHNREADEDIYQILKEEQDGSLSGVLHCFSSSEEFMKKCIDLGFNVSFTGNITFKKSNLSEVVLKTPNDRIMIETDSPYMTPVPFRGKRNEPSMVKLVAEKISEIKQITIDEVIKMTTKNAKSLFKILTVLFLLFSIGSSVFSQDRRSRSREREEYYENDTTELENPYPKLIGFGPMLGTNTVVETFYLPDQQEISFEGILAYGGSVIYYPLDFLSIEAHYMYSKNMKIVEQFNYTIDPNIYQVIELTSHWSPNPYNIINFFGTAGITYFSTSINKRTSSEIGLNFGLGFLANIKIDGAGIFAVNAEWRLDFGLNKTITPYYDRKTFKYIDKERTVFYSIPRFGIIWFPSF